ncbi:UNVERIFIED_CONTAM: hypothetical protein PYX00_008472 [Menopon gallinae]|uniref:Uncharacterized protein n=1 Tax=Menopon gallinae TaxID=328185 RepID=A0AAW2HNC5_9NEOP
MGYDVNEANKFLEGLEKDLNTDNFIKSYDKILVVPGCSSVEITQKELITLRDSDVHMLDKISSTRRQAAVAELLYRYSQIWTTNNNKWLHLGLASFFARFHLDKKKTDEKLAVDQFVVDQLEARALEFDGYTFSKALERYNGKNESYEQYDPILVSKGGSIMMTLEQICGDEFENIFKDYVKAPDNQKDIDKFAVLFKECFGTGTDNENINAAKSYFKNWNENPGYPVIHVIPKNTTTTLQQEHFRWNGKKKVVRNGNFILKHKGVGKVILKKEKKEIEGKNVIIDNSKGYFRVNYAQEKWKELATKLKNGTSELSALNRARLINDVFSLARSTAKFEVATPDYSTALSLSEYLKKEDEYLPLKAAFNEFEFLDVALYGSDLHKEFRSYFNKIIQPLYEKTPLNKDELPTGLKDKLKLKTIASWACRLNAGNCVKHAEEQYGKLPKPSDNNKKILLDERQEVILCSKLRQSSEEWETIFARLKEANDAHTQLTYITALGCSNKKENIEKLMNHGMSGNFFSDIVFAVQAGGPENVGFVLDYMKQNIDTIIKKIGKDETENVVKSFYGKVNEKSIEALKAIGQKLSGDVKENTGKVAEGITEWKKQKLTIIGNFLNGSVHTAPAALVLLLSTLLPIAKYIFH